jgi:hypothetical protein
MTTPDDVAAVRQAVARLCGGRVNHTLCAQLNDLADRLLAQQAAAVPQEDT